MSSGAPAVSTECTAPYGVRATQQEDITVRSLLALLILAAAFAVGACSNSGSSPTTTVAPLPSVETSPAAPETSPAASPS